MNKPTYEQLEAEVKQLAAENAALKEFVGECAIAQGEGNWTSDTEKTVYVPASEWIPPTPATDVILASLRAEGVEMFAYYISLYNSDAERHAHTFAAQLRSKSKVQS